MENGNEKKAVLILWRDGIKINIIKNDKIIKHSWRINNIKRELSRKHNNNRKNNKINIIIYWFVLVSDSAIRLIIGNKIIIAEL